MRLNLYLRGVDLIDVELHMGSRGLYVDLSVFKPREGEQASDAERQATTSDLSGTAAGQYEHAGETPRPDTTVTGGFEPPDEDRGPHIGFTWRQR